MSIPTRGGLKRDDDLRAIIRETLERRGVHPSKALIEDVYILCIKVASNEQYLELKGIVEKKIDRMYGK